LHDSLVQLVVEFYRAPNTSLCMQSKVVPAVPDTIEFNLRIDAFRTMNPGALVGVHCHYSYNRTGFMIANYLVDRMGKSVDEALQAFAESRPPGIK